MMTTVIEGGSTFWITKLSSAKAPSYVSDTSNPWYADPKYYDLPFLIEVQYDSEDPQKKLIDGTSLMNGIRLLQEKMPKRFANIMSDNWDAEDTDCWFQFAVLGEIVYG